MADDDDYPWYLEDGDGDGMTVSRSDTPSSSCSIDNSKSPGTSCESPVSPSTENLSPDQVPYNIGVNENNPYGCHYCEKAFNRLSFLKVHEQVRI